MQRPPRGPFESRATERPPRAPPTCQETTWPSGKMRALAGRIRLAVPLSTPRPPVRPRETIVPCGGPCALAQASLQLHAHRPSWDSGLGPPRSSRGRRLRTRQNGAGAIARGGGANLGGVKFAIRLGLSWLIQRMLEKCTRTLRYQLGNQVLCCERKKQRQKNEGGGGNLWRGGARFRPRRARRAWGRSWRAAKARNNSVGTPGPARAHRFTKVSSRGAASPQAPSPLRKK